MKSQVLHSAVWYFWWGCRGNLKLITLGSERVNWRLHEDKVNMTFIGTPACDPWIRLSCLPCFTQYCEDGEWKNGKDWEAHISQNCEIQGFLPSTDLLEYDCIFNRIESHTIALSTLQEKYRTDFCELALGWVAAGSSSRRSGCDATGVCVRVLGSDCHYIYSAWVKWLIDLECEKLCGNTDSSDGGGH